MDHWGHNIEAVEIEKLELHLWVLNLWKLPFDDRGGCFFHEVINGFFATELTTLVIN